MATSESFLSRNTSTIHKTTKLKPYVQIERIAAILSIWTYGLSLVVLWLVDIFLLKKLSLVAICYKCRTNFRNLTNMTDIRDFDHEMNDRIVYADHDFKGKPLSH